MEPKIDDFDEFVGEVRSELRVIVARLTRIEARLDSLTRDMATKADLAALESTMVKWFIGTAIAIAGLSFAAARLIH